MSGCALLKSATMPSITLASPPPTSTGNQKLSCIDAAARAGAKAALAAASPTSTVRRVCMTNLPSGLSLESRVHVAAHEVALRQEEHEQHRRCNEQRRRHQQVPVGRHLLADEEGKADRQGADLVAVGDDERPEIVIPMRDQ